MPISTPLAGSHIDYDEPCTFWRHVLVMVTSFFLGRPQNAGFRYEIVFRFLSWNAVYLDRRHTFWIYRATANHSVLHVVMIRFYTSSCTKSWLTSTNWKSVLPPPLLLLLHSSKFYKDFSSFLENSGELWQGLFKDTDALRRAVVFGTRVPRASAGPRERFASPAVIKSCSLLSSSLPRSLLLSSSLPAFPFCLTNINILG